jgi:hypothetical protein
MNDDQKQSPFRLLQDDVALGKLAASAGKTSDEVRNMIQRFQMLTVYQNWVRKRKAENKRLPRDMDEMQTLVRSDLEKEKMKVMRARTRRF